MKPTLSLVLLLSGISALAQIETETEAPKKTAEIIEQSPLVVTEVPPDVPAPLASEANTVNAWSGGASLTTNEHWQNQRAANIKDVLDFVPGIFAQQRNGAESARITIRGSGLGRQFQGGGLLLLQDGIPLNNADGSFDFQAVDPALIDYITAYRGSNGMALGGSTLGGVINLGSTLPNANQQHEWRLATGSFATHRAMFGYTAGQTHQNTRLRLSHFSQAGYRVQNQQRTNRVDVQHLIRADHAAQHRFGLFHLDTNAELPSSLSQALINENPRQSRGFNIFGNFNRDLNLTRLSYQYTNPSLSATFFVTDRTLDNPVFTYINRDSLDAGMTVNWQRNSHHLIFNAQWGDQDELRRENEGGFPGANRLQRKQQAQTLTATYLHQKPLSNPAWSMDFGLQAIYAQRDILERFPQRINSKRSYAHVNPRIAISYKPQANHQWFSSLSGSFEAPTFAELNNGNRPGINAPIKAQKATTLELGSKGFTANLKWDLSIYFSQLNDEFIRFRFPDGATRTTNAKNSRHWGLESMIQWQIRQNLFTETDQLAMTTAYQWTHFILDDDIEFGNNRIPGVPEHYLQTRLEYRLSSHWLIAPSIEWVPSAYYVDLANSVKTNNYLLTGLNVVFTHRNGWQWFLDAKNLNDQTYISTTLLIPDAGGTDGNYFYSGEGRSFFTGIRWTFH